MQQNLLNVLGIVDEDHGRGTLFQSPGTEMARRSLILFRTSCVSLLLNATIQAINAKMDHEHFFERKTVRYLSTFWSDRSAPPMVLLQCLIRT